MKSKRNFTKKSSDTKSEKAVVQKGPSQKQYSRPFVQLPSVETFALIAATIQTGITTEPGMAVHHAFQLWVFARQKIDEELAESSLAQLFEEVEAKEWKGIPIPESFPVTFTNFLKLNVKGKTVTGKTDRFEDFLHSEYNDDKVRALMADYSHKGIPDAQEWLRLSREYRAWWAAQLSNKARASAGGRRKKSKKFIDSPLA